jgi:hypothetical protein
MLTIAALVLSAAPQGPVLSRVARPLPGSASALVEERALDVASGRVMRRATVDGAPVDADATLRAAIADLHRRNGKLHPSLVAQFQDGGAHEVAFWLVTPAASRDLRVTLDDALAAGVPAEDARRLALRQRPPRIHPGECGLHLRPTGGVARADPQLDARLLRVPQVGRREPGCLPVNCW